MRYALLFFLFVSFALQGQQSDFDNIDFTKADSIATSYKGESLKNLPVLTHKLTAQLSTDVEKFRALYSWVCTNIENDYGSYLKTSSKRKKLAKDREAFLQWNQSFTPKVFEKLVNHKKTACTGYAYLIREMAALAGLHCKIIDGYGRTATLNLTENSIPNHSWNAIELNKKWYLCDATWSAGRIEFTDEGTKFVNNYHDGYFLADPILFVKNHYPVNTTNLLLRNLPSFNSFITGPIVYKEAFKPVVIPIAPKEMHLETIKNKKVSFVLQIPNAVKKENISIQLNTSSTKIIPEITKNKTEYTLQYPFTKTGSFDVHILVNDLLIATYVVKVKRR